VDGGARIPGATAALAVYGWQKETAWQRIYWRVMVTGFFSCSALLHLLAGLLFGQTATAANAARTVLLRNSKTPQRALLKTGWNALI
jgi:hypothetical protein